MSLEFIDGFDHYTSGANMAKKWTDIGNTSPNQTGRFGSGTGLSINVNALFTSNAPYVTLPALATRLVGFAFNAPLGYVGTLLSFLDGGGTSTTQIDIKFDAAAGLITVFQGATLLGTCSGLYVGNRWYYLEVKATINSTTGAVAIHISPGAGAILSLTNVNTQSTANATTNGIRLAVGNGGVGYDDLYVLNTSGSVNNSFLGESRILTSLPNADGANSGLTPNSGTAHFSRVNEANPDDDTTYNGSSSAGAKDTYSFAAINPTGNIVGVQAVLDARKDDVGGRSIIAQYHAGSTDYDGATQALFSSYVMFREIYETDPATGIAWTTLGVNGGQFGARVA